jgi:hypothetical protein
MHIKSGDFVGKDGLKPEIQRTASMAEGSRSLESTSAS